MQLSIRETKTLCSDLDNISEVCETITELLTVFRATMQETGCSEFGVTPITLAPCVTYVYIVYMHNQVTLK